MGMLGLIADGVNSRAIQGLVLPVQGRRHSSAQPTKGLSFRASAVCEARNLGEPREASRFLRRTIARSARTLISERAPRDLQESAFGFACVGAEAFLRPAYKRLVIPSEGCLRSEEPGASRASVAFPATHDRAFGSHPYPAGHSP